MSKGKIDVVFNVTSYGSDPKVLMRAMLRKEGSNTKGASIAVALVLKPHHEIKKFETFQLIAANYKKLDELDQAAKEIFNFNELKNFFEVYNEKYNGILVAYLLLHENINGTQLEIRTSPFAGIYLTISKTISKIKDFIVRGIKWVLNWLYKQRRKIALMLLLVIAFNGLLYRILVEVLIFLITYVIRMINLETYISMHLKRIDLMKEQK